MPKQEVYCKNRTHWRSWLKKNHNQKEGVWLVFDKGEHRTMTYDDIVEEAICFGWIDSLPRAKDKKLSMLYISPRKPKSNWSELNRKRASKMIKSKKMHASGLKLINLAKKSGTWTALKAVEKLVVPKDLALALNKNKSAKTNFSQFPPSSKRAILEWIMNAKKAETRQNRINKTAKLAAKNIKANHYRQ